MKELDILNELIQKHEDKTSLYWAVIILLGLNLIAAIANFLQTFYIKNSEEKQYRKRIREDRRINILENLYSFLEELTYFNGKESNDELLIKISSLEKYSSKNSIYISKEIQQCLTDTLDYFRSLTTNYRKKNYETESNHLSKYISLFNK